MGMTRIAMAVAIAALLACGGNAPSNEEVARSEAEVGATVVKGVGGFYVTSGDMEKQLLIAVGMTLPNIVRACETGFEVFEPEPVNRVLVVLPPSAGDLALFKANEVVPAYVYPASASWEWGDILTGEFDAMVCAAVLGGAPIASGMVKAGFNSNDAAIAEANRTAAWRFTVNGTVETAGGDAMRLVHAAHCTMKDVADLSTLTCNTNTTLK